MPIRAFLLVPNTTKKLARSILLKIDLSKLSKTTLNLSCYKVYIMGRYQVKREALKCSF